jgi:hypothetical protein
MQHAWFRERYLPWVEECARECGVQGIPEAKPFVKPAPPAANKKAAAKAATSKATAAAQRKAREAAAARAAAAEASGQEMEDAGRGGSVGGWGGGGDEGLGAVLLGSALVAYAAAPPHDSHVTETYRHTQPRSSQSDTTLHAEMSEASALSNLCHTRLIDWCNAEMSEAFAEIDGLGTLHTYLYPPYP